MDRGRFPVADDGFDGSLPGQGFESPGWLASEPVAAIEGSHMRWIARLLGALAAALTAATDHGYIRHYGGTTTDTSGGGR